MSKPPRCVRCGEPAPEWWENERLEPMHAKCYDDRRDARQAIRTLERLYPPDDSTVVPVLKRLRAEAERRAP